jgi:hypothetical protein
MSGWQPSAAHRRWSELQNFLKARDTTQPWPADKVAELVAIAEELVRQQREIVLLISRLQLPWALLRRDMNRLARLLGSGLMTLSAEDMEELEAAMRRRYADETVGDAT